MSHLPLLACFLLFTAFIVRFFRGKSRPRLPYPPGPPTDPIIGHFRIMPKRDLHLTFHQWSKIYGDVMCLEVLGKPIVVLSSEQAASDLLDKRSANYSDRPQFPIHERIGWKDALAFVPYGPYFRKCRTMIHGPFERSKMHAYMPIKEQETATLLMNLMKSPYDLDRHVHQFTVAVIIEITYGHRIVSSDDEYFRMADRLMYLLRNASRSSLLNISTLFEKLPAWFPGAWFTTFIRDTKPFLRYMIDHPVSVVQQEMEAGTAKPSFVLDSLDKLQRDRGLNAETWHDVAIMAHQILGGGSETSWHTIMVFVVCMMSNPDTQRKAQEEIDRAVGNKRLPDFTDRDSLPYVQCVVQETMRWHPVSPLGVPHRSVAGDEYRGFHIPKGAVIFASTRNMTLNEERFHDPYTFKPERFLPKPAGAGEEFPHNAIFGWGRRICPGRFFAENMVWLAIARILAAFNVTKARDAEGNEIEHEVKFVTGITSHPEPFPCDIRPRSEQASSLIMQAYEMIQPSV